MTNLYTKEDFYTHNNPRTINEKASNARLIVKRQMTWLSDEEKQHELERIEKLRIKRLNILDDEYNNGFYKKIYGDKYYDEDTFRMAYWL